MSYNIVFSPLAESELQESFDWYEEQVSGLGKRFVNAIDKSIIIISLNPKAYPVKKKSYHEMAIKNFPFIIAYEIVQQHKVINILHVFHTSRKPTRKYKR